MTDLSSTSNPSLIEWAGGPRAIVAVVFTDIRNSTALAGQIGDESMHAILEGHFAQSERLIGQHDGYRIKGLGDGDLAAFRSVDAALDYALTLHADPGDARIEVRAGIHVGPVRVLTDDIRGGAVNFAARVGGATKAPEIWISHIAFEHLIAEKADRHQDLRWMDHPAVDLKGLGVHRLWSLVPGGSARTMAEIVQEHARLRAPALAVSNIPDGMVPRHFVGREEALRDIAAALQTGRGCVAITALHGLRGVGKTVVAAAYAEQHRVDYRAAWWVRAETESGLRADLVDLGVRLGWVATDEKEEPALAAVSGRLRDEGDGILLIFDNARDAEALRPWLPRGGACRVIVTSNAPNWGAVATAVAIRVWPKRTGADFLLARTGRPENERAEAATLSDALGGLPLAHEMAASYCERTGVSFAEYCRRFDAAPARLLDSGYDAPADYHDRRTVAKTFALAIEEAAKLHPAAEPLLMHAALLMPEPIPLFLFSDRMESFDEPLASFLVNDGLGDAIAALRKFSLLECETIADEREPTIRIDSIRLHRLVREISVARIESRVWAKATSALIEIMSDIFPADAARNPKAWPKARRLDSLAFGLVGGGAKIPTGAEAAAAALMNNLATYRKDALAVYTEVRSLYEHALSLSELVFGKHHSNTLGTLNNIACVIRDQGDLIEARKLFERILSLSKKIFGHYHVNTATALNNLAGVIRELGDLSTARSRCEQALNIRLKVSGPNHPDTATSMHNVGLLLLDERQLPAALQHLERAFELRKKTRDAKHPDIANSFFALGALFDIDGEAGLALKHYKCALAMYREAYGPDHPDTLRVNEHLGRLRDKILAEHLQPPNRARRGR